VWVERRKHGDASNATKTTFFNPPSVEINYYYVRYLVVISSRFYFLVQLFCFLQFGGDKGRGNGRVHFIAFGKGREGAVGDFLSFF
jgi:hypothetical protein